MEPTLVKAAATPAAVAPAPPGRRTRLAVVVAGVGLLASVGVVALAPGEAEEARGGRAETRSALRGEPRSEAKATEVERGAQEDPAQEDKAQGEETPSRVEGQGVPPEDLPGIEQVRQWAAAGRRDRALRALAQLRKEYPSSAYVAFLEGNVNFDNLRWMDGLESYRAAIRADARYGSDPTLIRNVLKCLVSDRFHTPCETFLRRDIGAAAKPYIEEAARSSPYANVQARASRLLARGDFAER